MSDQLTDHVTMPTCPRVVVAALGFRGAGWDLDATGHPVIVVDSGLSAHDRHRYVAAAWADIDARGCR